MKNLFHLHEKSFSEATKSLKMQLRDFQAYDVIYFISARFPKQQMLEEAAFPNRF